MRSTLPAKPDGGNLRGSWPAIWMLGTGNGHEWPRHGEIDIVEMVGSRASNQGSRILGNHIFKTLGGKVSGTLTADAKVIRDRRVG